MSLSLFKQAGVINTNLERHDFRSELIMEAFLESNPSVLDQSLQIISSQFHLSMFSSTTVPTTARDGRIDLLGILNDERLVVIEVKKDEVDLCALAQLVFYLSSIQRNWGGFITSLNASQINTALIEGGAIGTPSPKPMGILVGARIADDVCKLLSEGFSEPEKIPFKPHCPTDFRRALIEDLKKNGTKTSFEITAYTLERYVSESEKDTFFLVEDQCSSIGPAGGRVRFDSIHDYTESQRERYHKGGPRCHKDEFLFKEIHDAIEVELSAIGESLEIIYAKNDISFNLPAESGCVKRNFVYLTIQKGAVTIYVHNENSATVLSTRYPDLAIADHSQSMRYPNGRKIRITCKTWNDDRLHAAIRELVVESCRLLKKLCHEMAR